MAANPSPDSSIPGRKVPDSSFDDLWRLNEKGEPTWACEKGHQCRVRVVLEGLEIITPEQEFKSLEALARHLQAEIGIDDSKLKSKYEEGGEYLVEFMDIIFIVLQHVSVPEDKPLTGLQSRLRSLARKTDSMPSRLYIAKDIEVDTNVPHAGTPSADLFVGKLDNEKVALKAVRVFQTDSVEKRRDIQGAICREALLWRRFKHAHVADLYGVWQKDGKDPRTFLVTPWMANGNLRSYLENAKENKLLADPVKFILEAAQGLQYMHSKGYIHSDVKGAKILVSDDLRALITGFGLTVTASSNSARGGTYFWDSPELLLGENMKVYQQSDVWSLGMTLYEVLKLEDPWKVEANRHNLLSKIEKGHCWKFNHEERPSMASFIEELASL